jgi:predicted pyridoxine 5'-phosphate oxidase superfamily flavin-nucleotide-binding protein
LTYGFQNILQTGAIGLIFLIPGVRETLRVNGRASLTSDPALLESFAVDGKAALLCTRVTIHEVFFHCAKAFIRSKLWQPESWRGGPAKDAAIKQWATRFAMDESAVRQRLEEDYRGNL